MNRGEYLTRLAVWLAVVAYTFAVATMLLACGRPSWLARARWGWTLGCAFFVAHVAFAFQFHHHWSHGAALRETARQTGEMTGIDWGGGLFLNYMFGVAWLADVLWWWLAPASFARRSARLTAAWQGFFFFMVFNGAVVFAHGPVRWFGALLCAALACLWWFNRRALPPSSVH
jgi:hypothetical protein